VRSTSPEARVVERAQAAALLGEHVEKARQMRGGFQIPLEIVPRRRSSDPGGAAKQAEQEPDVPALVCGGVRWTFGGGGPVTP